MNPTERELVVMPVMDEMRVALPRLKNAHMVDLRFMELALCVLVPSVDFFSLSPKKLAVAKETCADCKVRQECLEYSIITEQEFGVFGGQDERQRLPLIKQFQKAMAGKDS